MELQEILEEFYFDRDVFPRRAIREAIARREEITPELLRILDEARHSVEQITETGYLGHYYAMYLLAQFRETRAYPLIISFFSKADEEAINNLGDMVTEDLARILASVCGDDTGPIKQLAENPGVQEYVRHSALDALVVLAIEGLMPREEVIAYFQSLFHKLERKPHFIWGGLVSSATHLWPGELMGEIRQAFADGLVEEDYTDLEWIEGRLALGKEALLADERSLPFHRLIGDAEVALERMDWHAPAETAPVSRPASAVPARANAKIGRNEPCPCGSGKKYKKCCGA